MSPIVRNKTAARKLIKALKQILTHGPDDPRFGICRDLNAKLEDSRSGINGYDLVSHWCVDWPGLGEDRELFNVPGGKACVYPVGVERAGEGYAPKWEGDQLAKRQDLLRYLITRAETYL